MPVVYRCSRCGYPLYVFPRVGWNSYGVPTPSEVIAMYDGVCPACGKPLRKPSPSSIRVLVGSEARLAITKLAERWRLRRLAAVVRR